MLRGERLVAADGLEHAQDVAPLHLLERHQLRRDRRSPTSTCEPPVGADLLGQVVDGDLVEARRARRALDAVLQLAHVAGPGVGEQPLAAAGAMPDDPLAGARGGVVSTKCWASSRTSPPRARSGGSSTWMTLMRKKRSSRKRPLLDGGLEVAVGRGDEADVERHLAVAADRPHRPLLQRAQQLRLQRERQLADLVEEERAAVRLHEEARARAARVGEGAARVAEQLALEQRLGHRGAVDGDERPVRAPACAGGARARPAPCRCRSRR